MVIRGLVFDMDDTLYDEADYVRSGFGAVARAAGRSGAEIDALTGWLEAAFMSGARGDTFDRLRAAYPDVAARFSTAALVDVYRAHRPDIHLTDDVSDLLDRLCGLGLRLGVLTDGPVASQAAKAAALGLARWFEPILITGGHDATFTKPGTAGFAAIADVWGLPAHELAYVGDNPAKDFIGPHRLGWTAIRLSRPGQLHHGLEPIDDAHAADIVIDDLAGLLSVIDDSDRPAS
jgi:putative hydrolase of the HAD superfamily